MKNKFSTAAGNASVAHGQSDDFFSTTELNTGNLSSGARRGLTDDNRLAKIYNRGT
jgi:hypothetical protein